LRAVLRGAARRWKKGQEVKEKKEGWGIKKGKEVK
jgi:hypothetical protein